MKKIAYLLCLALLVQCFALPVMAAETTEETDTSQPETTEATVPQTSFSFGSVCVQNGCRTIEGQVPLGGSDRLLSTAKSVFVYETNTNTVVYAYNPDTEMAPGALTKIVSAMVVLENSSLEDVVTVIEGIQSRVPSGAQVMKPYLANEEQMTVNDLLHAMILINASDAAVALAEHVAGTQDAFVTRMNQWVKQIGCTNTEFFNVHGVGNDSQHTTARDMARIVMEATKNETFMELFGADEYTIAATNKTEERSMKSLNYLKEPTTVPKYNDKRVTGGVATYSSSNGASLACTAEKNSLNLVCVVLGCTRELYDNGWQVKYYGNFDEMVDLLEYTFNNFKVNRVLYEGQALEQFSVIGGESQLVGECRVNIDSVLRADCQMKNLMMNYNILDGKLTAPVEKDDMIGTVEVWYGQSCLMEAELYAKGGVKSTAESGSTIQGTASRTDDNTGFASIVGTACLIVLAVVGAYLIINSILRERRRAQRRRRRASRRRSR